MKKWFIAYVMLMAYSVGAQSLYFDGGTNYVEMQNEDHFDLGGDTHTFSFWVKGAPLTTSGSNPILSKNYSATDKREYVLFVDISLSSNELLVIVDGTGNGYSSYRSAYQSTKVILDDNWHHVAVVMPNPDGVIKIYVDAIRCETEWIASNCTNAYDSPEPFRIALDGDGRTFEGNIADVRIYNRELSSNEIAWLYYSTAPHDTTGVVNVQYPRDRIGDTNTLIFHAGGPPPGKYYYNGSITNGDTMLDFSSQTNGGTFHGSVVMHEYPYR